MAAGAAAILTQGPEDIQRLFAEALSLPGLSGQNKPANGDNHGRSRPDYG
jgi:hypothetical protein